MAQRKQVVTNFQLFTLVLNNLVATGIYTISRVTSDAAGRGAVIAVPLAGGLAITQLYGMYLLARRFPDRSLPEYVEDILGSPLGKAYMAGYAVVSVSLAIVVPRNFWLVLNAWILRETPQPLFLFLLITVCWNIARRGIVVLSRVSEVAFYLSLVWLVFVLLPLTPIDLDYLRPIPDRGWLAVAKGVLPAYFSMTGFDIFLFAYPFTSRRSAFKTAALAVMAVTVLYTITIVLIVGTLSLPLTLNTTWPLQQYLSRIRTVFAERIDVVILIAWVIQVIMTITIPLFMASACLKGIVPTVSIHTAATLLAIVLVAALTLPITLDQQSRIVDMYSFAALGYTGTSPFLLWILAVWRNKGVNGSVKSKQAA